MKKNIILLVIVCCFNLSFVGCTNANSKQEIENGTIIEKEEKPKEIVPENTAGVKDEEDRDSNKVGANEVDTGNPRYKESLTEIEISDSMEIAKAYYSNEIWGDLISMRIADNNNTLYQNHKEYTIGNIIIYEVETTQGGEGFYRNIALARNSSEEEWEIINEGV